MAQNIKREYERNQERYSFLRWASEAFSNFRVLPPGVGICHQVNLENLGQVVWTKEINGELIAYPDSVVGTDSHTTMINALGILGWGVGGIEAEAAMLGQPISMLLPEVVGVHLKGKARAGITATDIVLAITQALREKKVVGKFVEFCGAGLDSMALEDRATISNMAPEYGATCGFFPVDEKTLDYLSITGRSEEQIELVRDYLSAQGLFRTSDSQTPTFSDSLEIDLDSMEPALAGPKRPQDKVLLRHAAKGFNDLLGTEFKITGDKNKRVPVEGKDFDLGNGDIVIAAITSCTNTSNPRVMLGAGLLAQKALAKGLTTKPWVKTSLAPGSQVVADYLARADLQKELDQLGFQIVGFGCTTCIGNSGPLDRAISAAIAKNHLTAAAVLSGNRNFEGRIHADVKANYLASPMLVVAYALAGSMFMDLTKTALGTDKAGAPVYLKDIWPSDDEITNCVRANLSQAMFRDRYADLFKGDEAWSSIQADKSAVYNWFDGSTYVRKPPFFESKASGGRSIKSGRVLALLGDSITTDHISPAGSIAADSPAATYLEERQVRSSEFNSYGARRGNHEIMMRGTFANIRLRNKIAPETEGGFTKLFPSGENVSIFAAAHHYEENKTPLVVFAGKEYGTGSSRDWAAKGPRLLGVQAVVVESFERIHRSNLVGMGVLPLQFQNGESWKGLGLTGAEEVSIDIPDDLTPRQTINATITFSDGKTKSLALLCRIDTDNEVAYYKSFGILPYVLDRLAE
jgi:aconitate hydratase